MINIYFNPEFSGEPYINPRLRNGIMMDSYVVNLESLVRLLESRCGLVYNGSSANRLTVYRRIMKDYISRNPGCLLEGSFKVSELSTAKTCLMWRDMLIDSGWNADMAVTSKRIAFLAEMEKSINEADRKVLVTLSDRIYAVISRLPQIKDWLKDGSITIPFELDIMPPLILRLIQELEKYLSVNIQKNVDAKNNNLGLIRKALTSEGNETFSLAECDDSFEIWKFRTEQEEMEYITSLETDVFDLCINADARVMDSWLKMEGKPTVGSVMADSNPQIAQLLTLGIGLFEYPLNIRTMLQWLSAPKHPLSFELRSSLARKIRKSGGYYNDECQKVIDEYLASIVDMKQKDKEQEIIKQMLPKSESKGVNIKTFREFVSHITQWANKSCIGALTDEKYAMDELSLQQMENLYEQGVMLLDILQTEKSEYVNYNVVESWIKDIYEPATYHQYKAMAGCRTTISSPACIIDSPSKTLWTNFIQNEKTHLSTEFLHEQELDELRRQGCSFWDAAKERRYNMEVMLMPFQKTSNRLVLSYVEIEDGKPAEKHPLLIILEKRIANLKCTTPNCLTEMVSKVDNSKCKTADVVRFNNTDKLFWKDKESYSSLQSLIEHPMDYTFSHLLEINDGGKQDFENVERTKGEVAHKVIELLFDPKSDNESMNIADIRTNISSNFDVVFNKSIEGYGAILQLLENETEMKLFRNQLYRIVGQLADILEANSFRVKACEKEITTSFLAVEKVNAHGFVDMIVVDKHDNPSVIDFKWSTSGMYKKYIEENRSLQLALYKYMVSVDGGKDVHYTGYFQMPEGKLYTHDKLNGKGVVQIDLTDENKARSVINEIINSYRYRREQIGQGRVELADNMPEDDIQYLKDKESRKLLPLSIYDGKKSDNRFSQIKTLTKNAK